MKKSYLVTGMALAVTLLSSGCGPVIQSSLDLQNCESSAVDHESIVIHKPYHTALKNLEKGLDKCAEEVKTGATVAHGSGGGIRMTGDLFYHQFKENGKKAEYNYRMLSDGISEGDCATCQPKGGYYLVYATLEKTKKNESEIRTHSSFMHGDDAKAIQLWAKGDLSSCHGFMGKD